MYIDRVVASFLAVFAAAAGHAQHQHGSTATAAGQTAAVVTPATSCTAPSFGPVPDSLLQRPVRLRSNLGKVHEQVTTTSKDAQAFYDQGLAYLHGYVWIEAARSFHQALRHDPAVAMAHVGLSRAYLNLKDKAAAQRHAEKAVQLAQTLPPRERLRADAQLAQVAAAHELTNAKLRDDYRAALDAAIAADIDNPEVWLLRGNAEESAATGIGQQGRVATIAYYEAAMKRAPEHPAPYHYLVHTYENLSRFHDAAAQGERYATLSPAVPHALHMYGHDLMKTGRIPDAIDFFSRADAQERSYYNGESVAPELDWHHAHNLSLLGMSHRYLGQTGRAESLFREIVALKPYMPEYAFMYKLDLLSLLLSTRRAGEVLEIAARSKGVTAIERAFDAVWAGRAHAQLGAFDKARDAHSRAVAELPEVEKLFPEWPGFAGFITRSYIDLLDGIILYGDAKTRGAGEEKLRAFVSTVRAAFTGPDQWIAGLYDIEEITRLAIARGDLAFAEEMAKQLEEHDAAYPGTHYAQALLAEKRGDDEAHKLFSRAAGGWKDADEQFVDARHARTRSEK